jgi:hypothetical protein
MLITKPLMGLCNKILRHVCNTIFHLNIEVTSLLPFYRFFRCKSNVLEKNTLILLGQMDQKTKLAFDSDLGPFLPFFLKAITTTSLIYPVNAQYGSVFMYFAKHAILRLCMY